MSKKLNIIFLFLLIFLFSGCDFTETAKVTDDIFGEVVFDGDEAMETGSVIKNDKSVQEEKIIETYKDLEQEDKNSIDVWIEEKGYNRYGDSAGVIYAGGTPLFDETTGETIDRYDYILRGHPELIDFLNSSN